MSRVIALLTDFGTTDTYVGVMKGVMLGIAPEVQFVDLTHAVQPQNVKQAAFLLLNSYRYFPPETIFLVVVDPGVGSTRKPIAARAAGSTFVAPDNGVLTYVLRDVNQAIIVELDNPEYQLEGASNTFHGRDIFAPAAAHLAAGMPLEQLGSPVNEPVMLPEPPLVSEDQTIRGEVLHVDHFGSAITSIGSLCWCESRQLTLTPRFGGSSLIFSADDAVVSIGSERLDSIHMTFAEAAPGEALALVGSSGYLELAINGDSFAARFGVQIGATVELQIEQTG